MNVRIPSSLSRVRGLLIVVCSRGMAAWTGDWPAELSRAGDRWPQRFSLAFVGCRQICGRGPRREQGEGVGGAGGRLGGIEGQSQTGFGEHVHAFEGEIEFADGGVVEPFGAGSVQAYGRRAQ
jgi:hypothetical protein